MHAALRCCLVAGFSTSVMAQPSSLPASALEAFPNTVVDYYDVGGATVTAINSAIRAKRAIGPGGKVVPASTSWSVKADFDREVSGGRCTIRAVRVDMVARAELPRLADGAKLTAAERQRWNDYVGLLERGSASLLAFVHQNLPRIESAIASTSCNDARSETEALVGLLRRHADKLALDNEKRLAALSEFKPAAIADSKLQCRDLAVTGSRLRTIRTCLPAKEWERMWKSSSAYTQEVIARHSTMPRDLN